ncbi:RloB family protein [Dactylosporangium sp. CA-092794]|uniref:RloB family protein n=1 Tax=Dactylosporangium sp. CA-092794 TaxID=3239929 RepID=UPI003D91673D
MPFPRENAIARRVPYRPARRRQLVIGGLAEVSYLTGLYAFCANPAVQVHHAPDPIAPAHLVALAEEYQTRHGDAVDEVWVLLDGEDLDWNDVAGHADQAGIRLAVSNPCFETWLLLHFHDKPVPAGDRDAAMRLLRQYLPDYDPRRLDFTDFRDGLADAVDRAKPLALRFETELAGLGAAPPNPYTGVWALAESIATKKGHAR